MQFLVSVLDDKTNSATEEEMTAITAFNERIIADGNWVFAGGLAAPSAATVVDNRGDAAIFTDGPYLESKEYIAGLWIMEAPDLDAARALVTEASKACNRRLEVRPFL
ncbi:YciI family protein [Kribbella sp. NBC_00662]|uniref:YciI family protein n=1 Tax=Kribbella sp. NBC_00662 TaxID=2975969 RepID=UPI003251E092